MTQILPDSDVFDDPAAQSYGTFGVDYLPTRASNAGTDTTTGFAILFATGDTTASVMFNGHGRGKLGLARPAAANGSPTAYVFRNSHTTGDVKVESAFRIKHKQSQGSADFAAYHRTFWVGARISNGTLTAGGGIDYLDSPNGYWFALNNDILSASSARWQLLRKDTAPNQFTLLAETAAFDLATLDLAVPRAMRLEVEDESGDVRLKCYHRKEDGVSTEVEVFNFLDTDAARIVAAGRCGFVMQYSKQVSAIEHYALASYFQVERASAILVRDEWDRARTMDLPVFTDTFGNSGNQLEALTAGFFNTTVGPWARRSVHVTHTERLEFDPATEPLGSAANYASTGGWLWMQRPASDQTSQRKSLDVLFDSTGSAPTLRAVSIVLRSSGALAGAAPSYGYQLVAYPDEVTPGNGVLELWRWFAAEPGTPVKIAELGSLTIDTATEATIDLECFSQDDVAGVANGVIVCKARLGGSQQVLVAVDDAVGVTADAVGTVYDTGPYRVKRGFLEGFHICNPSGTRIMYVDDWTQQALSNSSELPERDMASVALDTEGYNHSGLTLTSPISWAIPDRTEGHRIERMYEDGTATARVRFARERRRFGVQTTGLTLTERDALLAFFEAREGATEPFYWTPPGANQAQASWRFASGVVPNSEDDHTVYSYSFELEEVFA